jgi:DNA-binding SARP family transcriptional activator
VTNEVFDEFPYGLLLLDRSGTLSQANRAAGKFLGTLVRSAGSPASCCELFGCRSPGVLEGICLSERAAQVAEAVEEVRVTLPPGSPATTAWVTVARLGEQGLVAQLRPAHPRDRRRRTRVQAISESRLRILTLGSVRIESGEGEVGGRWLEQRTGQLLKYLVCERRRIVQAEEIAAAIWPEGDQRIVGTVRYFVHRLRRELEPERPAHGPSSFLLSKGAGYRLDPFAVWVDADAFEEKVQLGISLLSAGNLNGATKELEEAARLYRGEFLADEPYATWALAERDRLHDVAEVTLRALVKVRRDQHEPEAAERHMRRLGELAPYDIDVRRAQIALCLARGRRSEALRRYSTLKEMLREAFGDEIDFELSDLRREAESWRGGASTS